MSEMIKRIRISERFWQMARESVAVLAAILIAFSLDAWWEERRDEARMLDALDAVATELQVNIGLLDEAIATNENSVALSQEVLRLSPDDVDRASPDEIGRWMGFPNYEEVRLQLGAVTAFIEGGFLAELPERSLRSRLASIPRLQEEIDEEAGGVSGIQWKLSENFVMLVPVDDMLASSDNATERGGLLLRAIAADEMSRRFMMNRSFALGVLYNSELERTREQITAILEALNRWRGGGETGLKD